MKFYKLIMSVFFILALPTGREIFCFAEEPDNPVVYNLNHWTVEENVDPVEHALEVYKNKSRPSYRKHVWLTDKRNGTKHMIAEYSPHGTADKIIFSPDENFMYYLGVTPGGQNIIYGINLSSQEKFSLGAGEDFKMVNCPDKKSYIALQAGQERPVYNIYTVAGEKINILTDLSTPIDLEKALCP
ncbi:MAG: hypothetical protein NUV91_03280 [Candidatus Omnitrophica bacterium]|nr:hypothetical protein [Candidatus Omnitrophota bacterium]